MRVAGEAEVIGFDSLDYGDVFLTDTGGRGIVRAVRAFTTDEDDGRRTDRIATVGPFLQEDGEWPGVHDPIVLRGRPVLSLAGTCQFKPSLDSSDLLPELPAQRDCRGCVILRDSCVLLCITRFESGGRWDVCFLDVSTGEITFQLDTDRVYVTSISAQRL